MFVHGEAMQSNDYKVFLYILDSMGHLQEEQKASSVISNLYITLCVLYCNLVNISITSQPDYC